MSYQLHLSGHTDSPEQELRIRMAWDHLKAGAKLESDPYEINASETFQHNPETT